MAHRPPLLWRFWIYAAAAYLLPVFVQLVLPETGSSLDELVWLVTLVPAFILSVHFGLRGAFVALLVGTAVFLGVQLALVLAGSLADPRITVPIYIAYGALAISVGWLSEELHEHYGYALDLEAAQKTEALGIMTAGIAHDFNNILTTMMANAELIAGRHPGDAPEENQELAQLRAAARRGAGMVRNLLGFSRQGMLALKPTDLEEVVSHQMPRLGRLVPEAVHLELKAEEGLPPVLADRGAVEQIVVNLVTNARDAMPFSGDLILSIHRGTLDREHLDRTGWGDPGRYVCLSVQDTGVGMDEQSLSKIFEPFFTGKEPGEAVGLGMAMVYGLMKQHRGFVDVQSEVGQGTTVRAYFPVAKERLPSPRAPKRRAAPRGHETVLLVEDDEAIRQAARRILERVGYTVLVAEDGEEALQVYREHQSEVDLVLSDVMLPKRTGPEFYAAIRTGPATPPVLFMSGYPAHTIQTTARLDPSLPFLQKPWTAEELAVAVRDALDAGNGVEVGHPTGAGQEPGA
jgi:two-component system, cell cycle sensor histidine kinase and response regulator CckA